MIILSYPVLSRLHRLPVVVRQSPYFLDMLRKAPSVRVEYVVRRIYRTLPGLSEDVVNLSHSIVTFL